MRSSRLTALAALLAVVAVAASAGALAGTELDPGADLEGDGDAPAGNSSLSGGYAPPASGNGGTCILCEGVTARGLLGLLVAPVSPVGLAIATVLAGLGALAYVRGGRGSDGSTAGEDDADREATADRDRTPDRPDQGYDPPGENAVYRAYERLTAAVELSEPDVRTPREYERAAVEAGYDPQAVRTVVETFETVRYGESGPTDDHCRGVQRAASELGLEGAA